MAAATAQAQQTAPPRYSNPAQYTTAPSPQLQLPQLPVTPAITPNGKVVEDVVARVNDQIITRSAYEHAEQQMVQDAQQQNIPQAELADHLHNLLRDLIDQQLLLSKGKELGINCDSEVIRRLDDLRKQNHLDSMEALEKAASSQGVSFEDFKQGIANQCITSQVVRDEVGRHLQMTHAQEQAYYTAHSSEFSVPEQVHLSEILISTPDNATDAQIADAKSKADAVAAKLKAGAIFADLAKTASGGPTASAGGDLGDFKRGTLGDVLEKATFSLPSGGVTPPIRTRQGFVILRVDNHQAAGTPPLEQVEQQVQEAIYMDQLQPALRDYLTKARQDAYLDVKAGFVDTGSNAARQSTATPKFTAYAPPPIKRSTLAKQKAEQEKAAKAAAELAAARERVAEKQAAKAAADAAQKSGVKNASKVVKPKKIRREKIRYGQAPRNSLPAGLPAEANNGSPIQGQAPGVAMAPTESTTTNITTGTSADAVDPLAQQDEAPTRKTRFASRQQEQTAKVDEAKLNKAEMKATDHPVAPTSQEAATEKTQAAPLGLNGDTVKKPSKPKRQKGDPKNRLQDKPKPAAPAPVAPTVNPALGAGSITNTAPEKSPAPSADTTTLPPVNTGAPGAGSPTGQPVPATTSADPNQPATTPTPH